MNKKLIIQIIFAIIFSIGLIWLFGDKEEPVEVNEEKPSYNFVDPDKNEYSLIPAENYLNEKKKKLIQEGRLFPPTQQDYIDSLRD